MPDVELYLGLWTGYYEKATTIWLRWYDQHFNLIPTPLERAQAEKERERAEKEALAEKLVSANKEKDQAQDEKERLQAEKEALLAKLKALGIDLSSL